MSDAIDNCRLMVEALNSIIAEREISKSRLGRSTLSKSSIGDDFEEDEIVNLLLESFDAIPLAELEIQRNNLCRLGLRALDAEMFRMSTRGAGHSE
jgi:hypothetical protein